MIYKRLYVLNQLRIMKICVFGDKDNFHTETMIELFSKSDIIISTTFLLPDVPFQIQTGQLLFASFH